MTMSNYAPCSFAWAYCSSQQTYCTKHLPLSLSLSRSLSLSVCVCVYVEGGGACEIYKSEKTEIICTKH